MFDRLLRNAPPEARSKLLGVLAVTSWGGAALALIAGWPFGLAWVLVGLTAFALLRAHLVPAELRRAPLPSLNDDGEVEPEPESLVAMEDRVLARLHQLASAEEPPVDESPEEAPASEEVPVCDEVPAPEADPVSASAE